MGTGEIDALLYSRRGEYYVSYNGRDTFLVQRRDAEGCVLESLTAVEYPPEADVAPIARWLYEHPGFGGKSRAHCCRYKIKAGHNNNSLLAWIVSVLIEEMVPNYVILGHDSHMMAGRDFLGILAEFPDWGWDIEPVPVLSKREQPIVVSTPLSP